MGTDRSKTIVIAGASGFIGSKVLNLLAKDYQVIALTRGASSTHQADHENMEWRQCDLFSLSQTRTAMKGATLGLYLVHSMLPSSELTQANAQDLDYLAADNFAVCAKELGLEQIVYVAGLNPQSYNSPEEDNISTEVSSVLASYGIPTTTLRCGIVLGSGSSYLTMLIRLVERLPIMICPRWTLSESAPIGISDLAFLIRYYLENCYPESRTFDVAGGTTLSYREIIKRAAKLKGKSPIIFGFPLSIPGLSSFWISTVTGAPRSLVEPLVASLRCSSPPDPSLLPVIPGWQPESFDQALKDALDYDGTLSKDQEPFQVARDVWANQTVRSVQRIPLPRGWTVSDVAHAYIDWLPRGLRPFLKVNLENDRYSFHFTGLKKFRLLQLKMDKEERQQNTAVLKICGGLLLKERCNRGRLEFRLTRDGRSVIAAIHDYRPSLPWVIYRLTQSLIHKAVMYRFASYLSRQT